MIACDAAHADRLVYGEALRGGRGLTLEAGINCHLCPREGCAQRAFPHVEAPRPDPQRGLRPAHT